MEVRPDFHTTRFHLRPLRPEDLAWLTALHSDPEVMRYIPGGALPPEQAAREADGRIFLDRLSLHLGLWAIEDLAGGEVHGWVALKNLNINDIEVGYRLSRPSWGRGIATEAAARILEYGFADLDLDRIVAVTMPGNAASERVLAKLGLRLQKRYPQDGVEWHYFAITRAEWERQRTPP